MNRILFLMIFPTLCLMTACQDKQQPKDETPSTTIEDNAAKEAAMSSADSEATSAEDVLATEVSADPSIEPDIQFIRDKYAIISKATNYKTVPFEMQCDEVSSVKFDRKYNEKGELSYLLLITCGEHGCNTTHHYYWDGKLMFIFSINDFTPGTSHIIEERRTYFKGDQVIRCLEKTAYSSEGQPPAEELLKKAKNQNVDYTPEFLSDILMDIETLSVDDAKAYFCQS